MSKCIENFCYRSESLRLEAREAPWDTSAFGYPVALIDIIEVNDLQEARKEFPNFMQWVQVNGLRLISCRLPSQRMIESMLLEENEFRFIETVLHPVCAELNRFKDSADPNIVISPADEHDLMELRQIAEVAFTNERYYVDTRVDRIKSGKRYGQWVINAYSHQSQRLLKVMCKQNIVAFFVCERNVDDCIYWHLTAINPKYQGKGYGRRVWFSMLANHHEEGVERVSTTIAARNIPVLNLYSSLNFRFEPPETTFHWVNSNQLT
jgi:GNAT superfamily N-acetyltransferase